jgi:chromate reductase
VKKSVGILVGSLRRESFSRKIAHHLFRQLYDTFDVSILDGSGLPLYNQDLDLDGAPQEWIDFRAKIKALDGVIFVTPEYNRSMPASLKNAIDIASRPPMDNAWDRKPGGVIGVSTGRLGGFGSSNHLRQTAMCVNIYMMATPETYLGGAADFFDEDGEVTDEHVIKSVKKFADAYTEWFYNFVK